MAKAIWIGAVTGARPGEIRALRISDFHAEEGRLGVERAISDGQVWATKNRQIRDNHLDDVTTAVTQQIEFLHARAGDACWPRPARRVAGVHGPGRRQGPGPVGGVGAAAG